MATDDSTTPAAPAASPTHGDVINAVLNLKGAIHLSREAVYRKMGIDDDLVSAEAVLELAEAEIDRLNAMIDCNAVSEAWPTPSEEVAHDD